MLEEDEIEKIAKIHSNWAALASHFIGICFDHARPLIDNDSKIWNPYLRVVSNSLYIDCHQTSESVLLLISHSKEWDADIITRSVIEGTLKYIYMLDGSYDERLDKAFEYWDVLPSFSCVKISERLKRFFEIIDNPDSLAWRPFKDLIMTSDQIKTIRENYNKTTRKQMEERWSFSGITSKFSDSEDLLLRQATILAHNYGMSSHLLHKDGVGGSIIRDRFWKESNIQGIGKLAHAARIISDICVFSELRLKYLFKLHGEKTLFLKDLKINFSYLFDELDKANEAFISTEYGVSR